MYQEVILDHYKNPTHAGLKAPFDAEVHHVNPSCGDELTLRVKLSDDKQTVVDVSYEATGCSISQASVSVMAEEIVGKPLPEALEKLAEFEKANAGNLAIDAGGNLAYLAPNRVNLNLTQERWPDIVFHETREHSVNLNE